MITAIQPNVDIDGTASFDNPAPNVPPIVVATDGTDLSRLALEAARNLTARERLPVRVVAVVRDLPVFPAEFGIVLPTAEQSAAVRDAMLLRVKAQLIDVAGSGAEWPIDMRWGDAAQEIAAAANEAGARLILLGVEHRKVSDRLLAHETAMALLRLTPVPLLVVPQGFSAVPRRMTVAIDFSFASLIAARLAMELFPSISHVDLVYVRSIAGLPSATGISEWMAPLDEAVDLGFSLVRKDLESIRPVTVSGITLHGRPSREITRFARKSTSDLLIMGSSGAGMLERMLVGSTSRPVLRHAPCAALAVHPASDHDGPFAILDPHRDAVPVENWGKRLEEFSGRNTGRLATIEVLGSGIGSQVQDRDVRFLGATWDPHDKRLEIMTGKYDEPTRHHTRNIANVQTISILRDAFGRDWILRVTDGETQTLVTLGRH